jgi:hypothetical protein
MKRTDKKVLLKGIKIMALCLPLLFLAPYLMTLGFINKEHTPILLLFFVPGLVIAVLAGYLMVLGLRTIMRSMFGD